MGKRFALLAIEVVAVEVASAVVQVIITCLSSLVFRPRSFFHSSHFSRDSYILQQANTRLARQLTIHAHELDDHRAINTIASSPSPTALPSGITDTSSASFYDHLPLLRYSPLQSLARLQTWWHLGQSRCYVDSSPSPCEPQKWHEGSLACPSLPHTPYGDQDDHEVDKEGTFR